MVGLVGCGGCCCCLIDCVMLCFVCVLILRRELCNIYVMCFDLLLLWC